MPDRIDAAMDQVQRTAPKTDFDRPPADPALCELPTPHHPMLMPRELGNQRIDRRRSTTIAAAFAVIETVNAALVVGPHLHGEEPGRK